MSTSPSERTPLLPSDTESLRRNISGRARFCDVPLAFGIDTLRSATSHRTNDPNGAPLDSLLGCVPPQLSNEAERAAYTLICLLHLRQEKLRDYNDPLSMTRATGIELDLIDKTISHTCDESLADQQNIKPLEDILWTEFPLGSDKSKSLRVMDYMQSIDAPACLILHPKILLSLTSSWKHGLPFDEYEPPSGHRPFLQRYEALCTPRALYTLHLGFELFTTGLLTSYILEPPTQIYLPVLDKSWTAFRIIFLAIYSLSNLFLPSSSSGFPFACILLSIFLSLPNAPAPDSSLLFLAFLVRLYHYHTPLVPSPLFLFPRSVLYLSATLHSYVKRVLVPVILFFLPVLIFINALVGYSNYRDFDSRLPFLIVLIVVIFILILFLFFSAMSPPSRPDNCETPTASDRNTSPIELETRVAFIRCLCFYGQPYTFPSPFNLLHLLFVGLPSFLASLLGREGIKASLERRIWYVTVAPFGAALGLCYQILSYTFSTGAS